MARKSFALNTEPHVAEIGAEELEFLPEVESDLFLDAYEELQAVYREAKIDTSDLTSIDAAQLRQVTGSLRVFLTKFMLPASAEAFAGMRLPDRILMDLMEFVTEVYGRRPSTLSSDSPTPSRSPGSRGTAASRSKASTPARGRSAV
ncbi:hypothetical protein [Streptomyces sp. H27-H5]|uniref:hypothetical protein n=1 Tax=Streptomyces sp. H27-H5 TaxID=2996460 RepID=UPI00226DB294|nr:hypothetical protein [Streptomyces sp. H27-H5]MCY0957749.1 hypothetical protein [Streptomyces sp. H27-H5]